MLLKNIKNWNYSTILIFIGPYSYFTSLVTVLLDHQFISGDIAGINKTVDWATTTNNKTEFQIHTVRLLYINFMKIPLHQRNKRD